MHARLYQEAAKTVDAMCWSLEEGSKTTGYECEKAEYVFERILNTMAYLGVIEDYNEGILHDFCQEMNKDNEEE